MSIKEQIFEEYKQDPGFYPAVVFLSLLLFCPPYFRGLFFPVEQMVALQVALLAFFITWIWKVKKNDLAFLEHPMDYLALALVLAYLIAIIGAANYRLAVQGFLKASLYFLIFWLAARLGRQGKWGQTLCGVVYVTGLGVAGAGLLAALQVIDIKDGFVGDRIFSTLQYPNALAVFLLAISFLGFYFWATSNTWRQYLFATGNYLLLLTFLGTNSRGAFLIAPLVMLLFVLGLPREHRPWVIYSLLFTGGAVLVGSLRFIPSIVIQDLNRAWLFLGLGLLVALAGQSLIALFRHYLGEKKGTLALAGLFLLGIVSGVVLVAQREVIPNQITNPNEFAAYNDAGATMTPEEDGWKRVDVTRVGNHQLAARTGGYRVQPGETVTYSVELKDPSGKWIPFLTGSVGVGDLTREGDNQWTITWTNTDEVARSEYIYWKYLDGKNIDVNETFYYRNPTATIGGKTLTFWEKILPRQLAQRLQTIDLEGKSGQERLLWPREALKLVKARPFFGFGGGAWEATYRSFLSYGYSSTQVHNDWAQLAAETGLVGSLAWLGLWLVFLYTGWKNLKTRAGSSRFFQWAVLLGALTIGGHAWIDFDLGLGAVSIILWFFLGLTCGWALPEIPPEEILSKRQARKRAHRSINYRPLILVGSFCLIFIVFTGMLLAGYNYGKQAVAYAQAGDGDRSLEYFLKGGIFDPFQASYNIDASRFYLMKGDVEKAISLGEKAVKKDRFNWQIYLGLADIYWQMGDLEKGVALGEKARECAPLLQQANNGLARVYALTGIRYLEQEEEDKARELFQKVVAMPPAFEEYFNQLPENIQNLWQGARRLTADEELSLSLAISAYFLGDFPQAEAYLETALKNEANQAEALLWLALVKEQLGQLDQADQLLDQVEEMSEATYQNYRALIRLPILS
ncbi:MAG TPA: tetratricopeptide repeat protein [Clostridia bacterium]|nr:tetratricopeptide repeat protein [Clostridia bacterium]